ncbi:MAG: hypothetical protein WC934_15210 [Acidithiobacillus sp.]|jgi:hypothetical protein|uniref:hypothetical protein n=1 Tax=Acidithiobacillus sp. TaxID=1872118 RepID=UPI00355F32DB
MTFKKIGTTQTIEIQSINNVDDFLKIAKTGDNKSQSVIADFDKNKFTLIHTTIMASVDTEENGYWITSETEKFINDNGDAWPRKQLIKDYESFKNAKVYVEHDQNPERARGRVFDAIARDMENTVLIDLLIGVDNRHEDLIANIKNGICNTTSMGCTTKYTICSICGNKARNDSDMCIHIARKGQKCKDNKKGLGLKGRMVECTDGKKRKCAELCYGNSFFDASIVSNPAFKGAVFRSIVASNKISVEDLNEILSGKIECISDNDDICSLKVASSIGNFNILHNKSKNHIEILVNDFSKNKINKIHKLSRIDNFTCKKCKYTCAKFVLSSTNDCMIKCPCCGNQSLNISTYAKHYSSLRFNDTDFKKVANLKNIKSVLLDPEKIIQSKIVEKIMADEHVNMKTAKSILWNDINLVSNSLTADIILKKLDNVS